MPQPNLTERQAKWFASIRAGVERETGKTLDEWVAIARTCPETAKRAQQAWLKEHHGLLQNRASYVLSEAFGSMSAWNEPDTLIDALWTNPASRTLFQAVDTLARAPNDVVQTARKGYTAWSRKVQFAAARPVKGGKLMLGLAVEPDASTRLEAPRNESWSERLKARVLLTEPSEADDEIAALLKTAWDGA